VAEATESSMDIDLWKRLREISERCAELPADQRLDWLQAQGLDSEACARVLSMVGSEALDPTDQDSDAARRIAQHFRQTDATELPGTGSQVGPWRLLEPVGEGGMGSVYRAERVDGGFEQEAAVKRMRAGLDQQQYLQRFEAERQILARLQHPHIARLLDGGCGADGSPYLALEYVRGQDIATYCDALQMDLRQRLSLFLGVCEAVAYAHRQLVVHRDIKPSNVMIDDEGRVKLLDFGVAKLLSASDKGSAAHTKAPLTPAYASPEQLRGLPASTQTDVYALGLLLFELLTGVLPQRARSSRSADAVAEVLTTEAMPPSNALQRLTEDEAQRQRIASARGTDLRALERQLRGDLDALLLKALRAKPDERYPTVDALAADISAYLSQRAVSARRGSRRYQLGRFVARNKTAVSLSAMLVLSLLVGVAATTWKAIEAQRERDQARHQAQQSALMRDLVIDIFRRANPTQASGAQISARDLLDDGLARIDRSELADLASKAQIRSIMADAYLALGATDIAHQLLTQALEDVRGAADAQPLQTNIILLMARAENQRGDRQRTAAALAEAEARIDLQQPSDNLAMLLFERGTLQLSTGEIEPATANLKRALAVYAQIHGPLSDPALDVSRVLAWVYDEAERYAEIDALVAPLITAVEAGGEGNPLYLADLLDAQANAASRRGQPQLAIDYRLRATEITADVYGARHRYTGTRWNNLAFSYLRAEQLQQAYEAMDKALTILRQGSPEGSHIIGSTASNFARIANLVGRHDQAEPLILEAIAIRKVKSNPVDVAYSIQIASSIARAAGNLSLARERAELAAELFAALPRQPQALKHRIALEHAEQDLLARSVGDCRAATLAQQLQSDAAINANPAQRAYGDFVHAVCVALRDGNANRPDLELRYQRTLELQPPESARRQWLAQYWQLLQ
jgi:serine/threonine-protein kinase